VIYRCYTCGADSYERRYCARCRVRAYKERQRAIGRVCLSCGVPFYGFPRATLCPECRSRARSLSASRRPIRKRSLGRAIDFRICPVCGSLYDCLPSRRTLACSRRSCTRALQGRARRQLHERTCLDCGRMYLSTSARRCRSCQKRRGYRYKRERYGTKYRSRARHFGVPFEHGVTRLRVFERDHWHCQLCGVSTPRRLSGSMHPCAPELDHIVALSAPGSPGHTWSNVQTLCKQCNQTKRATTRGQLRIF